MSYLKKGEYNQALKDQNSVIQLAPNLGESYLNRGMIYRHLKKYNKALVDYNKAVTLDSKLEKIIHINLGQVYIDMNNYYKALYELNQAIKLDNKSAVAYLNRGTAYKGLNIIQKAILDFTKALKLDATLALEVYGSRSDSYLLIRKYKLAIEDANKILQIDANNTGAYFLLGNSYLDMKQYKKSLTNYSKAIKLNPNYADAYFNRGNLYFIKLHNRTKGCSDWKKSCSLGGSCRNYNMAKIQGDCR